MYADNPRSRISREFFWILTHMMDYINRLKPKKDKAVPKIHHAVVLLGVFMLREEGSTFFRGVDLLKELQLPRTTFYNSLRWLEKHNIVEKRNREYTCLAKTPEFLLNPSGLYQRPLGMVKDKDYLIDEKIKKGVKEMAEILYNKLVPPDVIEE